MTAAEDPRVDHHDYYAAMTGGSRAERSFHPARVELIRGITEFAGKSVLEVGASTGPIAIPLAQAGADVVAVELGLAHCEALAGYATEAGVTVPVIQADGARLPFGEDAFDVVVVASVVHLLERPGPVLREAVRVCKPDGLVLVAGPWQKHPKSNRTIKTILRGGKPPDGRSYPFTKSRLARLMPGAEAVGSRVHYLLGYRVFAFSPRS